MKEDLSYTRCPKCNSRMRHARRSYYCSHCKKRYRAVIQSIKVAIVEGRKKW